MKRFMLTLPVLISLLCGIAYGQSTDAIRDNNEILADCVELQEQTILDGKIIWRLSEICSEYKVAHEADSVTIVALVISNQGCYSDKDDLKKDVEKEKEKNSELTTKNAVVTTKKNTWLGVAIGEGAGILIGLFFWLR